MVGLLGLVQVTREAAAVVSQNAWWMGWNLVLALVPLGLAVRLFRDRGRGPRRGARGAWWWAGAVAFVLFLPNAPYVLTDVVHLYGDVRVVESDAVLSLAVLPQYALFMLVGFASYVACLVLLEGYAGRRRSRWMRPSIHALSALGIYLGRVVRLNSWDAALHPSAVVRAVGETISVYGVLLLGITFCVLVLLTDAAVAAWGLWSQRASVGRHGDAPAGSD
ncbi:MAG TPA: DUF1361 domain-containing protein [Acidimicrobiales bacterium]|jgi:uncharacterized membrane protein|nr:DUF1361 domain-containing protein [Acidimicrobiales bacterium]